MSCIKPDKPPWVNKKFINPIWIYKSPKIVFDHHIAIAIAAVRRRRRRHHHHHHHHQTLTCMNLDENMFVNIPTTGNIWVLPKIGHHPNRTVSHDLPCIVCNQNTKIGVSISLIKVLSCMVKSFFFCPRHFPNMFLVTLWWTNIAMDNHNF